MPLSDVPVEHVAALWPHVREYIDQALKYEGSGRFETSDVLAILLRGDAKLWVVWNKGAKTADAAIITEIIKFPRLNELRIWLVGGRRRALTSWIHEALDTLEAFARARGCAFLSGAGRKGWGKIVGPNWREGDSSFEKDLRQ